MIFPNGNSYYGVFNGHFNGDGIFKTRAGEIYTGQFKNGSRNGKGVLNNVDGSNYTGFFKDGFFMAWAFLLLPTIK